MWGRGSTCIHLETLFLYTCRNHRCKRALIEFGVRRWLADKCRDGGEVDKNWWCWRRGDNIDARECQMMAWGYRSLNRMFAVIRMCVEYFLLFSRWGRRQLLRGSKTTR